MCIGSMQEVPDVEKFMAGSANKVIILGDLPEVLEVGPRPSSG